jgi:hypothetical protein
VPKETGGRYFGDKKYGGRAAAYRKAIEYARRLTDEKRVSRKNRTGVDPLSWTLFNDGIREVHDAPQSRCIRAGIPAEDGRAGPVWT